MFSSIESKSHICLSTKVAKQGKLQSKFKSLSCSIFGQGVILLFFSLGVEILSLTEFI